MYLIDYHTHSDISTDAHYPLEEMAAAAVAAGLSEMCITDHYDTLTMEGEVEGPITSWPDRRSQCLKVREQYRGRLDLRMGIEFGSGHLDDSALRCAPPELDFVIGSIHNRSPKAGGVDFFNGDYNCYEVCAEALDDYFASLAALAPMADRYDVMGHIIYPVRYMVRDGQEVSLDPWMDRIEAILKSVIGCGRGIEVNTYNGRTLEDWLPVLKLYRSLGGEIITTGSDAHFPENVGKGIPQAMEMLRTCGFRYLTTYKLRKPGFVKL